MAQIKLVISNKADAYVSFTHRRSVSLAHYTSYILERARNHGLPIKHIASQGKSREEFDGDVVRAFEEVGGVDLILLIGFMRIVSPVLIRAYPNRILNVHPSLLPEVRQTRQRGHLTMRPTVCRWHGL